LDYYFDVIDDYRPPWFDGLYPEHNAENIPVDTSIYFYVHDLGLGVDIASLVFKVNDLEVTPQVQKIDDNNYFVYYTPEKDLFFNAYIYCYARVEDLSSANNSAVTFWRFKTAGAELPMLLNFNPECCDDPVYSMSDIYLEIYSRDSGLDLDSLVVSIDGLNYPIELWPRIYRKE
jgi:hypothetical protein